jgi:nucleoside-diphosphate-sugar epimerase
MKILVTGATGFIGKKMVEALAGDVDQLSLMIRQESRSKAEKLFEDLDSEKIHFVEGDLTHSDLSQNTKELEELIENVDSILHLASQYDLEMNELDAYKSNVIGTQNILHLAKSMKKLKYFHHVSSYAINAKVSGKVLEDDLDDQSREKDPYSESKVQAEILVRNAKLNGVKKRIYRPGIVIGDSVHGEFEKIDGPYYFFKMLHRFKYYDGLLNRIPRIPFPYSPKAKLPLIPIDVLVDWMKKMVIEPKPEHEVRSYHLVPQKPVPISYLMEQTLKAFGFRMKIQAVRKSFFVRKIFPALGLPEQVLNYIFSEARFSVRNRKKDFPELQEFDFEKQGRPIFDGAMRYFDNKDLKTGRFSAASSQKESRP